MNNLSSVSGHAPAQLAPAREVTEDEIEEAYRRLGHTCGWRFMTCREANLTTAKLALVTLNPGEGFQPPPKWSMENGVSYFEGEEWEKYKAGQSPLQKQVQFLAKALEIDLKDVFSAQFVPFCSRSWDVLPNRKDTLNFCRELWRDWVLPRLVATTIIAIGKGVVAQQLAKLLDVQKPPRKFHLTDWKGQTIDRYEGRGRTLISIPHLSRYKIFGRSGLAERVLIASSQELL
jgi:hypothetical protein